MECSRQSCVLWGLWSEGGRTADTAELGGWKQAMNKIENASQVRALRLAWEGSLALFCKDTLEQSPIYRFVADPIRLKPTRIEKHTCPQL